MYCLTINTNVTLYIKRLRLNPRREVLLSIGKHQSTLKNILMLVINSPASSCYVYCTQRALLQTVVIHHQRIIAKASHVIENLHRQSVLVNKVDESTTLGKPSD